MKQVVRNIYKHVLPQYLVMFTGVGSLTLRGWYTVCDTYPYTVDSLCGSTVNRTVVLQRYLWKPVAAARLNHSLLLRSLATSLTYFFPSYRD